ncbi:MAG: hypothetical protein R3E01_05860 [Pirellulaceae bacterium]|nr:hypothetical protein [Planctomycetales bacterium]
MADRPNDSKYRQRRHDSAWRCALCLSTTLLLIGTTTSASRAAHFWLSAIGDPATGSVVGEVPSLQASLEQTSGTLYVWGRPTPDESDDFKTLTAFSLNLASSNPGVIAWQDVRVVNDEFIDPMTQMGTDQYRFQDVNDSSIPAESGGVTVTADRIDRIQGFRIHTATNSGQIYTGLGPDRERDANFFQAGPETEAWLIATVVYDILGQGMTDVYLEIGANGVSHAGEAPTETWVTFGNLDDSPLNAGPDSLGGERGQWSETADATIVVSATIAGDYNHNGVVDAADYTVWKDSFGSMSQLDADGSGNGTVDAADYTIWKDNFGNTALYSAAHAVPEPNSQATLLALLISVTIARPRCRRRDSVCNDAHRPRRRTKWL